MATANAGSLRTLLTEKDKSGGNFIIPEGHQNAVINVGTKALEMYKTAAHVLKPVISLTPDVLDQLASIHPLVAVTVNVFKMVVALEMQRKDNQKKIKVLVDVMEDSMGELTFIKQGKVSDQVEPVLKKLSEQSRSFGVFVQSYVDMSRTVKVFQSSGIQTKLNGFAKSFADIKVELSHKLQLQNSVAISNQSEALARQEDRLDQIMRILEAKSAEERSAEQFFSRHGGIENCKNDNQLIQELAASFGETINKDVISSIHSGFEQILAANQAQFDRVLEQQTKEFSNINVKLDALLDMGPHKLIRHKVVAEIWKKNDFGGSVKGKLFIEALYTHYLLSVPPDDPDHWMVNLLSLTYAQSIIDSIDVDLTGHLNVHEVNTFFDAKPAYFSLMEWLVYSGLVIDYQRVKYINESQAIVFEDMKGLNDQFDEETKKMLQPYFKEVLPDITRSKAKGWDITKKSQFAEYRRLIDLMERREAHMLPKIQDLVDQIGRYQRRAFMPNDYYTYRDDVHAGAEGDRMLQEDDADDNLAFVFLFQRELLKRHVSILSAAAEDPENAKLILSPTTIKNMIQDIKSIAQVLMEQAIDLYLDAERMKVADPISFVKRAFGGSLFTWYLHYEKVKHRLGSDFRVEEELTADVDASEAEIQRKLMYGDGAAAEQPEILGRTGSILRTVKEFESGQTAKAKELDVEVNPRGHLRESRLMEMERSIASIFEMRMENIKRNGEERDKLILERLLKAEESQSNVDKMLVYIGQKVRTINSEAQDSRSYVEAGLEELDARMTRMEGLLEVLLNHLKVNPSPGISPSRDVASPMGSRPGTQLPPPPDFPPPPNVPTFMNGNGLSSPNPMQYPNMQMGNYSAPQTPQPSSYPATPSQQIPYSNTPPSQGSSYPAVSAPGPQPNSYATPALLSISPPASSSPLHSSMATSTPGNGPSSASSSFPATPSSAVSPSNTSQRTPVYPHADEVRFYYPTAPSVPPTSAPGLTKSPSAPNLKAAAASQVGGYRSYPDDADMRPPMQQFGSGYGQGYGGAGMGNKGDWNGGNSRGVDAKSVESEKKKWSIFARK